MRWRLAVVLLFVTGCDCGRPGQPDANAVDASVSADAGLDAGSDAGVGEVSVALDLDFRAVERGLSNTHTGVITNSTAASVQVTLSVPSGPFAFPGPTSLTVLPGGSAPFDVRFAPTALGPASAPLTVTVDGLDRVLMVFGVGIGPSLRVPATLDFGTVPLYSGAPTPVELPLTLENVGLVTVAQATFEVVALQGDVGELCVANCQTGVTTLDPGQRLDVPVRLTALSSGPRRFEVRVFSNDFGAPLQTVVVTANVSARPTCQWSLPQRLDFGVLNVNEERRLEVVFENTGAEPCELTAATLGPTTPMLANPLFDLEQPVALPVIVAPGFTTRLVVHARGLQPAAAPGAHVATLAVQLNAPQGQARLDVQADLEQSCIVAGLTGPLDFGEVEVGCSSAALPLVVSPAAECANIVIAPLLSPGPSFQLATGGPTPTLRFTPTAPGAVRETMVIEWTRGGVMKRTTVELTGRAVATAQRTESFDVPARLDLLIALDDSPSMQTIADRARTELANLPTTLQMAGIDAHLGVITTDVTGNAVGALKRTANGMTMVSSSTPAAAQRFSELLQWTGAGNPNGSCHQVVWRALTFPRRGEPEMLGFRRADAALAVLCITNRPETEQTFSRQLLALHTTAARFTWFALAPLTSTSCSPRDADSHRLLTEGTGGARADVCAADWSPLYAALMSSTGTRAFFPLLGVPASMASVSVAVGGLSVPSSAGWQWSDTNNAVVFTPMLSPSPGTSVDVGYTATCAP